MNSHLTSEKDVYDDEKHTHFITFACYKRRKSLQHERASRETSEQDSDDTTASASAL